MQIKYKFYSKRLGFRTWKTVDIESYAKLSSDPDVMKFFPRQFWLDNKKAEESINRFVEHYERTGYTYFAVDLLETGEFIGFIGMKEIEYDIFFAPAVDIGWRLAKAYWGNGFATEGAKRALEWFFENFEEERIVSITPVVNIPSENVMKKIGMEKVKTFDHPLVDSGSNLLKHVLYEIWK